MLAVPPDALLKPLESKTILDELSVLWSKQDVVAHFLEKAASEPAQELWSMYENQAFTLANIYSTYPNIKMHPATVEYLLSSERLSDWIREHQYFTRRELEKTQAWIEHATIPSEHRMRLGIDVLHCLQLEILDKNHERLNLRDLRLIDIGQQWLTKTLFAMEHIDNTPELVNAIFPFPEWYHGCSPRIPWILSKAVLSAPIPETLRTKNILICDRYSKEYKLRRIEDPDTCWGYADFAFAAECLKKRTNQTFTTSRYNTFVLPHTVANIINTFECPDLLTWISSKTPGSFEELPLVSVDYPISL